MVCFRAASLFEPEMRSLMWLHFQGLEDLRQLLHTSTRFTTLKMRLPVSGSRTLMRCEWKVELSCGVVAARIEVYRVKLRATLSCIF